MTYLTSKPNWLPDMDLNHDKQIQSLLCYRYTIGQTGRIRVSAGLTESRNQTSKFQPGEHLIFCAGEPQGAYCSSANLTGFMPKRKQASRTPNASRITGSRSVLDHQGLREQRNLATVPQGGRVREACFRFGSSTASAGST